MYSKIPLFTNETIYSQNRTKRKNKKIGICIAKIRILQMRANLKYVKLVRKLSKTRIIVTKIH